MTKYSRWKPLDKSTWPYRCLTRYYNEINRLIMSHKSALKYTYANLAANGAVWTSKVSDYLYTGSKGNDKITIQQWSDVYRDFDNWTRLNAVMSLTSSFETYIESVVWLSIESDPGILINSSHMVDGIKLLKQSQPINRELIEKKVEGCTRGDWQSRIHNLKILLGSVPQDMENSLSDLEKLRKLRNDIGHAFGRDIKKSREYSRAKIEPMAKVSEEKLRKIQSLVRKVSKQLDLQLNENHIGNFPILYFYHNNLTELQRYRIDINRHVYLKNLVGKPEAANHSYSKEYCKWAVNYYENL